MLKLRRKFKGTAILAGGFTPASAAATVAAGDADAIAFGRAFLSNPDLPKRIAMGAELTPYDRTTFYTQDQARG